jgi:hypothetical protein
MRRRVLRGCRVRVARSFAVEASLRNWMANTAHRRRRGGMAARRARSASSMRLIGFLSVRSPSESSGVIAAFRQGLGESGFVEGQNLAIAFRWAEGRL